MRQFETEAQHEHRDPGQRVRTPLHSTPLHSPTSTVSYVHLGHWADQIDLDALEEGWHERPTEKKKIQLDLPLGNVPDDFQCPECHFQ